MVFQSAIEKIKTILGSKPSHVKPAFNTIEEKQERLDFEAVNQCVKFVSEIREETVALRHAVLSVAKKTVDPQMAFYKIALEHQRSFVSRLQPLQQELESLAFPSDCGELVAAQKKFSEILASVNRIVIDNRYVYAFFEKELIEFNQAIKRLLELNDKLVQVLQPAYHFKQQYRALEEREKQLYSVEQRICLLQEQLKQVSALAEHQLSEIRGLDAAWDQTAFIRLEREREETTANLQKTEDEVYSFLDAIAGLLKKYARGKTPGALAIMAERYLRDSSAFIEDCINEKAEVRHLLADLGEPMALQRFLAAHNRWVLDIKKCRQQKAEVERKINAMEVHKSRRTELETTVKTLQQEMDALSKKIAVLEEERALKKASLEEERRSLLIS